MLKGAHSLDTHMALKSSEYVRPLKQPLLRELLKEYGQQQAMLALRLGLRAMCVAAAAVMYGRLGRRCFKPAANRVYLRQTDIALSGQ
jgi:hypothetical protein